MARMQPKVRISTMLPEMAKNQPSPRREASGGGGGGTRGRGGARARGDRSSARPHPMRLRSMRLRKPSIPRRTRTIEGVVGVERNDAALGRHEMDTGALDVGQTEIEAVEKLHDGDAKDVVVARALGHRHVGHAAQEPPHTLLGVCLY